MKAAFSARTFTKNGGGVCEKIVTKLRIKKGQNCSCTAPSAVLLLCQKLIDRHYQSNPIPTEKSATKILENRSVSFCKKSDIRRKKPKSNISQLLFSISFESPPNQRPVKNQIHHPL
ncbi:hypothetical protein HRH25_02125 [Flavisolibacter sp. BT320]|nr:hypothetical protein [Flavisolibacter longurius]